MSYILKLFRLASDSSSTNRKEVIQCLIVNRRVHRQP